MALLLLFQQLHQPVVEAVEVIQVMMVEMVVAVVAPELQVKVQEAVTHPL